MATATARRGVSYLIRRICQDLRGARPRRERRGHCRENGRGEYGAVGEDSLWFEFQAFNLHHNDPDMLAAVLAGPDQLLAGLDPERTLPAIAGPVLLLQADLHDCPEPTTIVDQPL